MEKVEKAEEKIVEEKNSSTETKRLSMPATVLITIAATLGAIVVARLLYFIVTGN